MSEQETIERGALACLNSSLTDNGMTTCDSLDQIAESSRSIFRRRSTAVYAALRPGDVLPGGMVVEQGWQTMETAPKDGTRVLLAGAHRGGWWQAMGYFDPEFERTDKKQRGKTVYRGAWTDETVASFKYQELNELDPAHWRPLPATPKGGA